MRTVANVIANVSISVSIPNEDGRIMRAAAGARLSTSKDRWGCQSGGVELPEASGRVRHANIELHKTHGQTHKLRRSD